jgi:hypothetical protein
MSARMDWQAFKKKYPAFAKSKNFKGDFGPQLDKYANEDKRFIDSLKKLLKQTEDMRKMFLSAVSVSKAYREIAATLEKDPNNKGIWNDFNKIMDWKGEDERLRKLYGFLVASYNAWPGSYN